MNTPVKRAQCVPTAVNETGIMRRMSLGPWTVGGVLGSVSRPDTGSTSLLRGRGEHLNESSVIAGALGALRCVPWLPAASLVIIVAGGVFLRCWQATESLWLDELHTSWVVAEGADGIVSRAHAGNQSPLFFFIVWGVVQLVLRAAT